MTGPDLQSLADMPGAGRADQELAARGHPREPRPELSREYVVDVRFTMVVERSFSIMAESENQALDRARHVVETDPGLVTGYALAVCVDECSIDLDGG